MRKAAELLIEMDALTLSREIADARIEEIKHELEKLQADAGTKGFRSDELCYAAREMPGKRSLNKDLLMDNGVPLHVIKASYKRGKGYIERNFKRL